MFPPEVLVPCHLLSISFALSKDNPDKEAELLEEVAAEANLKEEQVEKVLDRLCLGI